MFDVGMHNQLNREAWLEKTLKQIPDGSRILDAGAGELQYKRFCKHLNYVAQDFAKCDGRGDASGLQIGSWDQSNLDIISDITRIPELDGSFDAVMCVEVFEHLPEPIKAIQEFARLLKPDGHLILTAPFASLVHFAPYYYCSGFSRYWYEHHLTQCGFSIEELTPNGDWFTYCQQELMRLGSVARRYGDWSWPLAYVLGIIGALYFKVRGSRKADDLACFGWHCVAVKN